MYHTDSRDGQFSHDYIVNIMRPIGDNVYDIVDKRSLYGSFDNVMGDALDFINSLGADSDVFVLTNKITGQTYNLFKDGKYLVDSARTTINKKLFANGGTTERKGFELGSEGMFEGEEVYIADKKPYGYTIVAFNNPSANVMVTKDRFERQFAPFFTTYKPQVTRTQFEEEEFEFMDGGALKDIGGTQFSTEDLSGMFANGGNLEMVKNQAVEVGHHSEELKNALKKDPKVDAWVVSKMGNLTGELSDVTHYLEGENNKFADGGKIKWQDVNIGDSANVRSENKTGIIVHSYGRKFHLKFVDGSEKTYDASDLDFIVENDEFADGGMMAKGGETEGWIDAAILNADEDAFIARLKEKDVWNVEYLKDVESNGKKYKLYRVYTENKKERNAVKSVVSQLKGWLKSMADGGMMARGGDVNVEVGDMIKGKTTKGRVYESSGIFFKLEDEYGTKSPMLYSTRDFKKSEIIKKAHGGMMASGGGVYEEYRVMIQYPSENQKSGWASFDSIDIIVQANSRGMAEKKALSNFKKTHPNKKGKVTNIITTASNNFSKMFNQSKLKDGGMMAKGGELKEGDFIRNANGTRLLVSRITKDEYYLYKFGSTYPSPWGKKKVDDYIATGWWTLEPKEGKKTMGMGGKVKFSDKVKSISKSLLKRKKVSPSVQKDYGKTYSKKEAVESAKRIAGAMRKKETAKKKR